VYIAKIDEIKSVSGPIVQRYLDKVEEERQAVLKAQEEENARRRAEQEAKRKAEEEAEAARKKAEGDKDTPMTDADKPDEVEEKE
jgi:heat shock 70kDa protein 4